jgi:hypothetical protein
MNQSICNETFNTLLKIAGIILVIVGFFIGRTDFMLLGIFLVLLVLANLLTCESFELSNQIGYARDKIIEEIDTLNKT